MLTYGLYATFSVRKYLVLNQNLNTLDSYDKASKQMGGNQPVPQDYAVIIVGGGHAGTEAALAAARMGAQTVLISQNIETLGQMSCNPAIGGIGKGHIVREIDAMGGIMAQAADHAGIQLRTLNIRKGPAVQATRAQTDRGLYKQFIRGHLEQQPGLQLLQQSVEDLLVEEGRIRGVITNLGLIIRGQCVVLAVGTFLGGKIHVGMSHYVGGRAGDMPANALSQRLRALPLRVSRLKTGTPPRIDGRSVDFSKMSVQPGDEQVPVFSFLGQASDHPRQVPCHITQTNPVTHTLIRNALHRSPLYSGKIEGTGPRYCPSIEDKVVRFADKNSHQIFVEPEGLETTELYPNGISTSLPFDVQLQLVRSICGFERAHITRPGYAIEYDYFDPRDLEPWLETRPIPGLFFAGQINGTTGYEEAAGQGLIAGINAALLAAGKAPWYPRRDQAYIGVMIDDLITRGTTEPYRMFTSRAEYRLTLREDNADLRLTPIGRELGLVDNRRWQRFCYKRDAVVMEKQRLQAIVVHPAQVPSALQQQLFGQQLRREVHLFELLKRPGVDYHGLSLLPTFTPGLEDPEAITQLQIEARYDGYLQRQYREIDRQQRHERTLLPVDFCYSKVRGLSSEVQQKLQQLQPRTLGQAARIPGITPAAISLLLVYLKKQLASCADTAIL